MRGPHPTPDAGPFETGARTMVQHIKEWLCRRLGHIDETTSLTCDFDVPLVSVEWSDPDKPMYPGTATNTCRRCGRTAESRVRVAA